MKLIIEFNSIRVRLSIVLTILLMSKASGDTPTYYKNETTITVSNRLCMECNTDTVELAFIVEEQPYYNTTKFVQTILTYNNTKTINLDFITRPTGFYFLMKGKIEPGAIYYIEPNENIQINISNHANKFELSSTGKYSSLLECYEKLETIAFNTNEKPEDALSPDAGISETINYVRRKLDLQLFELEKRKSKLSSTLYNHIQMSLFAGYNYGLYEWFKSRYKKDKINSKQIESEINKLLKHTLPNPDGNYQYKYLKSMLLLERLKARIKNEAIDHQTLIQEISTNYEGELRNKLLTFYLLQFAAGDASNYKTYADTAFKYISDSTDKNSIVYDVQKRALGVDYFNFNLTDTAGNIKTLEDFKGNILLIDIWFTGCTGCVGVAKMLENEIIPKYRDNHNIKFISISTDKEKERWAKSVKQGFYTAPESISLYTNGEGWDNSLIKYYKLVGAPQLMLVDKNGKTISTNLPLSAKKIKESIDDILR